MFLFIIYQMTFCFKDKNLSFLFISNFANKQTVSYKYHNVFKFMVLVFFPIFRIKLYFKKTLPIIRHCDNHPPTPITKRYRDIILRGHFSISYTEKNDQKDVDSKQLSKFSTKHRLFKSMSPLYFLQG